MEALVIIGLVVMVFVLYAGLMFLNFKRVKVGDAITHGMYDHLVKDKVLEIRNNKIYTILGDSFSFWDFLVGAFNVI